MKCVHSNIDKEIVTKLTIQTFYICELFYRISKINYKQYSRLFPQVFPKYIPFSDILLKLVYLFSFKLLMYSALVLSIWKYECIERRRFSSKMSVYFKNELQFGWHHFCFCFFFFEYFSNHSNTRPIINLHKMQTIWNTRSAILT